MERKNATETYELLGSANSANQFFVLQDDGTIFNINNKDIQYIAHVQDDKSMEAVDTTAVYDVSQQYYVDVESTAPDLMSIGNQFVIANGENNIYPSNFLIQPEPSTAEQMETNPDINPVKTDDVEQIQQEQPNEEASDNSKAASDFTEITLSDQQYQILEQKGWILLESHDKIFVLNTLGLHDITTDDSKLSLVHRSWKDGSNFFQTAINMCFNHETRKDFHSSFMASIHYKLRSDHFNPEDYCTQLIQKLKNELHGIADSSTVAELIKIDNKSHPFSKNEVIDENSQQQDNVVELVVTNEPPAQNADKLQSLQFIVNENVDRELTEELPSCNKLLQNEFQIKSEDQKRKCDTIKIKTRYTFSDIPDKIYLGKTVNGKKLFAKVTKKKANHTDRLDKKYEKQIENEDNHDMSLDEMQFVNIIQDSFRDQSKFSAESIAEADAIVTQLLQLPNVKDYIVGKNMVLTKIVTCKTNEGKVFRYKPTVVTGTVKLLDETYGRFVHIPRMLHKLLDEAESKSESDALLNTVEQKIAKGVVDLMHVHVLKMKFVDEPTQTTVNLSKRKLALDVLNDAKKKYPNPVYACGACAAVFKSQLLLKNHQNNHCLENEDTLTIDTDNMNTDCITYYRTIESGKTKWYACMQCEAKFTRLFNCQKHLKTHKMQSPESDSTTTDKKPPQVYKCKMCPSTYFHQSSLSKHIVRMHIQRQSDK